MATSPAGEHPSSPNSRPLAPPQPAQDEDPPKFWQRQQQAMVSEFSDLSKAGSPASRMFIRVF